MAILAVMVDRYCWNHVAVPKHTCKLCFFKIRRTVWVIPAAYGKHAVPLRGSVVVSIVVFFLVAFLMVMSVKHLLNVTMIATIRNYGKRLIRVAIEIWKNKIVNRDQRYHLCITWKNLLRKSVTINGTETSWLDALTIS